jgi:hypothetical protein
MAALHHSILWRCVEAHDTVGGGLGVVITLVLILVLLLQGWRVRLSARYHAELDSLLSLIMGIRPLPAPFPLIEGIRALPAPFPGISAHGQLTHLQEQKMHAAMHARSGTPSPRPTLSPVRSAEVSRGGGSYCAVTRLFKPVVPFKLVSSSV